MAEMSASDPKGTDWAKLRGGAMQFMVEYISRSEPSPYVIVRQLGTGSFELGPEPALDGIPVARRISQPRSLKPDGRPDPSIFVFQLLSRANLSRLTVGQVVELKG